MKKKWYLSTFVLILALLGYSRQQTYVPNQEIVVQFVDVDVSNDITQSAIAIVKKQLQAVGIANIQVRETAAGRLKITYYSELDVASIKRIFSEEISLELGYGALSPVEEGEGPDKFPADKLSNSYNLNVCEIQNNYDVASDFNGYILELNHQNEHYYNPVVHGSIDNNDERETCRVVIIDYKIQRNIALEINNSSRIIPEVRAGPASNTNS